MGSPTLEQKRLFIAYHEAGHAVVSNALGIRVIRAKITLTGYPTISMNEGTANKNRLGFCVLGLEFDIEARKAMRIPELTSIPERFFSERCASFWAGYQSERLFEKVSGKYGIMRKSIGGTDKKIAGRLCKKATKFGYKYKEVRKKARKTARDILKREWKSVEHVARVLLEVGIWKPEVDGWK